MTQYPAQLREPVMKLYDAIQANALKVLTINELNELALDILDLYQNVTIEQTRRDPKRFRKAADSAVEE